MKDSNTITTSQNIEVYENKIWLLVDEYINTVLCIHQEDYDNIEKYKKDMDEYLNNPEFERNMYRMGYHPDRSDMRMDGMNHKQSRYGESYDRYSENRRHYHDSNDTESKRKMDDSMKEYTSDIIRNLTEMWSDADATLRQSMKTDLTRLIQQMN